MINTENTSTKWHAVRENLLQRIFSGTIPPGGKLPTYDEMEAHYGVSRITLQQVMRSLKEDQFLISRARQGLFVNPRGPHRTRVGLFLPYLNHRVRFWEQILAAVRECCCRTGMEMVLYEGVHESAEVEQRMAEDIAAHRLCMVIVPCNPPKRLAELFRLHPELPTFGCGDGRMLSEKSHGEVCLDNASLARRAAEYFVRKHCRRIAFFAGSDDPIALPFQKEAEKNGLLAPEDWFFYMRMEERTQAEKIAKLLMMLPKNQRPDGIFCADDNYLPEIIRGVQRGGVVLPDQLALLSHYNWPLRLKDSCLPAELLGYDVFSMVRQGFLAAEQFREKGTPMQKLCVPALFESEVEDERKQARFKHTK